MNEVYENTKNNNEFLENVYGVLFDTKETYKALKQNPPINQAIAIVIIVSILGTITNLSITTTQAPGMLVYNVIVAGFQGILKWLFFAAFVEALASIFGQGGKFKIFLTLSGFALLPWIFIGPVNLLKTGGILFSLIGILAGIAIWVWTTILTIFAAMKTYEISTGKIVLLLSVPFFGGIILFNWLIGFFSTLVKILGT